MLALLASIPWTLFWVLAGFWEWPYFGDGPGAWLTFGAALAAGILAFLLGIFMMGGRLPGQRGLIVICGIALVPAVLIVWQGLEAQSHVTGATDAAAQAYEARSGLESVAADCVWEFDNAESETWRCDLSGETCFVRVTTGDGGSSATIARCDGDEARVSRAVQQAHERGGSSSGSVECGRVSDEATELETWGCTLGERPRMTACRALVAWRDGGGIDVSALRCAGTAAVDHAVDRAYARRRGIERSEPRCRPEWGDEEQEPWKCYFDPRTGSDECLVTVAHRESGSVTVRIRSCRNDLG